MRTGAPRRARRGLRPSALALGFLAAASAGLPGPEAAETLGPWRIEGTGLLAHPRLESLLHEASRSLEESLRRLEVLGGGRKGTLPVEWTLDLSLAESAVARGSSLDSSPFLEAGSTEVGADGIRVRILARRFVSRVGTIRAVVAHEAAHADLASRLGSRRKYESVPCWLREGLATWFAGEGDRLLDECLGSTLVWERPARSVLRVLPEGLGCEGETTRLDGFLALRWLESLAGGDSVAALWTAIARGDEAWSALERISGAGRDRFRALALESGRERVAQLVGPVTEAAFLEAVRLRRTERGPEAAGYLRSILREAPDGVLSTSARYLLGRECARSGSRGEAEDLFRKVLEEDGGLWRAESLAALGALLEADGRPEQASAAWEEVLLTLDGSGTPGREAREGLKRLEATRSRKSDPVRDPGSEGSRPGGYPSEVPPVTIPGSVRRE